MARFNKQKLIDLVSLRLEDPITTNKEFIQMTQQLIDLKYDNARPHRSRKWVQDRAKQNEIERHAKRQVELGMTTDVTHLSGVISEVEGE